MAEPEIGAGFWFPGRWLGGTAMVLGPILLLAGMLLRIQVHFFFPDQLRAAVERPTLMSTSYSLVAAGNIVLWPAVLTLARLVGQVRPRWAQWGGSLVTFGLFARTFHAGSDHLAIQVARVEGVQTAVSVVAATYGAFSVVSSLNAAIMFGWIVLAIGAYLSRTLPPLRATALGLMSGLMMGILKGSSWASVGCAAGLCIAMVPSGLQVLRAAPTPTTRMFVQWVLLAATVTAALFVLGRLG